MLRDQIYLDINKDFCGRRHTGIPCEFGDSLFQSKYFSVYKQNDNFIPIYLILIYLISALVTQYKPLTITQVLCLCAALHGSPLQPINSSKII